VFIEPFGFFNLHTKINVGFFMGFLWQKQGFEKSFEFFYFFVDKYYGA